MKAVVKSGLIIVIALLISNVYCVNPVSILKISGKVDKKDKPLEGALVTIYKNNKQFAVIRTDEAGKYEAELEYNCYFIIEFSKQDLICRRYDINTAVNDTVKKPKIVPLVLNVSLFPMFQNIDISNADFTVPAGKYIYYNKCKCFDSDTLFYKKNMRSILYLEKALKSEITLYNLKFNEANDEFLAGNYKKSQDAFQLADKIYPNDRYIANRKKNLINLLEDSKNKELRYISIIAMADELFSMRDYQHSKKAYDTALAVKPDSDYALAKTKELEKIIYKTEK